MMRVHACSITGMTRREMFAREIVEPLALCRGSAVFLGRCLPGQGWLRRLLKAIPLDHYLTLGGSPARYQKTRRQEKQSAGHGARSQDCHPGLRRLPM